MASYAAAQALLNRGVSRPTLYSVQMPQPFVSRQVNDYLNFYCESAAIPEVRLDTVAVAGHEYMGIVREQPTAVMFGKPFNMTVIENSDFMVYKQLRSWFDRTAVNSNQNNILGGRSQRMLYYETYTADMDIIKLEFGNVPEGTLQSEEINANYKRPLVVRLLNAYPVSIGAIRLDSQEVDAYTKFDIAFTYESYQVVTDDGILNRSMGQLISEVSSLFGF